MAKVFKVQDTATQYTVLRMMANILGIGFTSFNGKFRGKILLLYNMIYIICFYAFGLKMIIERKWLYKGFSLFTTICLYGQAGLLWVFNLYLIISTTFYHKEYYSFYKTIDTLKERLEIELHKHIVLFRPTKFYIILTLLTFPLFIISDVFLDEQFVSISFLICTHIPGIASVIYVNHFIAILNACSTAFVAINDYFLSYTETNLSTAERISLGLKCICPKRLCWKKYEKTRRRLNRIHVTHDMICKLSKEANNVAGISLFLLILFGGVAFQGLMYNVCMYFVLCTQGRCSEWTTLYSQDYWAVVYFAEVVALTRSASTLTRNAQYLGVIIHKLRNLYPNLGEEWINIYSIQLLHAKFAITAAKVYILDESFISEMISIMAILLLSAIQYDENYLANNPRTMLLHKTKNSTSNG